MTNKENKDKFCIETESVDEVNRLKATDEWVYQGIRSSFHVLTKRKKKVR